MADYRRDLSGERWWCKIHQRPAEFIRTDVPNAPTKRCCDPNLGGIMLPCEAVLAASRA
jgi:hypothetical protein